MEGTERTPVKNAKATVAPAATENARSFVAGQTGRVAVVVDGKTQAIIAVENDKVRLVRGDSGATRASMLVRSMEHFNRIVRGELNIVVASLRGDVAVRGDLTFAINVLRAIASGLPLEGAGVGAGADATDAKGG